MDPGVKKKREIWKTVGCMFGFIIILGQLRFGRFCVFVLENSKNTY